MTAPRAAAWSSSANVLSGRSSEVMRYRFQDFTLSPQRRVLIRAGREVPLIPRYFDLLVLLIERRHEAVHRREIFARVWADAIVSDSALSQAIRTLRRTLGDDSQEPRFIRTVSRHGYQFVLADVVEEEDNDTRTVPPTHAPVSPTRVWLGTSAGGALAGLAAGGIGGLILAAAPGSTAPMALAPVLAVIGAGCGALGGAGVGAGLSMADARGLSGHPWVLVLAAAIGGGLVGFTVQWLARWGLAALLGLDVQVGGGLAGVAIGGAAGFGCAFATDRRWRSALITASLCGLAGLVLTLVGSPLVGGTIHMIALAAEGSRATLAPLGRFIGEPDFGPVSSAILAFGEAATFGLGLAWGYRRRS